MNERMRLYRGILKQSPRLFRAVQAVSLPKETDEEYPLALAGSHVFGPALCGFVLWLLGEAVGSGKKRLYFLARDGYLMYKAARLFCEALRLPLECRYFSCSRYALRLPAYHLDHEAALDAVCLGGLGVTLRKILARAGLTAQEQEKTAEDLRLPFGPDEELSGRQLSEIRRRLAESPVFLADMDRHSKRAFPFFGGYLRQEGLLDGVPDALADSGWVGSVQQTLGSLLAVLGRQKPPEGYYWGLYGLPPEADRRNYHCYAFGPEYGLKQKADFNNCLFEAVFTAPHGMTVGYRREKNVFIPCYGKKNEKRAAFTQQLAEHILGFVRIFAKQAALSAPAREELRTIRKAGTALLAALMRQPSSREAEIFGQIPFSDDILDGEEDFLAARMTERELQENHLLHRLFHRHRVIRQSAWYAGSAVRDSAHPRRHIRQYALYRYLLCLKKQLPYRFAVRSGGRSE